MKKNLLTLAAILCCAVAATVFTSCHKNEVEMTNYNGDIFRFSR